MKKLLSGLLTLFALIHLSACAAVKVEQSSTSTSSVTKATEQTVQLIVQTTDGKSDKTVTFKDGDSVMDILKANFTVEETNGMVTSIDGLKQDEAKNTYWMYKVNDTMADKGAAELQPKAGDVIEFYQEKF